VQALGAELLHAARDHVLDLRRIDTRALDDALVGGPEELVGMGVLVVALLQVPAADRRPGSLDDDDLAALELAHVLVASFDSVSKS
jgi:hypothetical protein